MTSRYKCARCGTLWGWQTDPAKRKRHNRLMADCHNGICRPGGSGIWCFRDHAYHWLVDRRPDERRHTLGNWLICQLVHHETARDLALILGVVAADEDGGELYWRARFWRPSPFRRPLWSALRRS